MKVITPTKKEVSRAAVVCVSAGTGFATSRAANAFYPKEKMQSALAKILTSGILVMSVAAVSGKTTTAAATRSALGAAAGEKLISGISDVIVDQEVLKAEADDNELKKFGLRALDIETSCGCNTAEATAEAASRRGFVLPALNYASTQQAVRDLNIVDAAPTVATFS